LKRDLENAGRENSARATEVQQLRIELQRYISEVGEVARLGTSVADPDPGSGAFLTHGSGIRNRFFPDPRSQTHIFESLVTIFWVKSSLYSLKIGPNFFLQHFKNKIVQFVKFMAPKKGMTIKIFSPLSFIAVFGSGIRDG
jgi:hypothetical protein